MHSFVLFVCFLFVFFRSSACLQKKNQTSSEMAYLQAELKPLFKLRINEPGRHFTALSALSMWQQPGESLYVNHKSATRFTNQATEFEFFGRLQHNHAVAFVRQTDHQILAIIEVADNGVVSMRHASSQITRAAMANPRHEHIAIMIGFPHELFTMCIFDQRHSDTDLIRYRPLDGRFYIPSQYLKPETRVNLATRNNAIMQTARDAAGEQIAAGQSVVEQASTSESSKTEGKQAGKSPSNASVKSEASTDGEREQEADDEQTLD